MPATCPECSGELIVQEAVLVSELIVCPGCEAELEVITVDPVLLALAPEVKEDWGE